MLDYYVKNWNYISDVGHINLIVYSQKKIVRKLI